MADQELSGKVIVLTGASSGFGKGAALKFAESEVALVLAARRNELLEELAHDCESAGSKAVVVPTDVSKQEEVELLAQAAIQHFGHIDVWVNDAGGSVVGRFEEAPLSDHVQVIETNLLGTLYGSYFALKQFRQQGFGTLINVASVLGKVPAPYQSSYVASKHGVVGLSAAIRQELEANEIKDVHVCTVMPTSMDTPFFEHAADYSGHKAVPIPPVYDPEEVVDAIVGLVTKPQDEVAVGGMGATGAVLAYRIAPSLVEDLMGKHTHHEQMEKAPSQEDTAGNLKTTSPNGTTVSAS